MSDNYGMPEARNREARTGLKRRVQELEMQVLSQGDLIEELKRGLTEAMQEAEDEAAIVADLRDGLRRRMQRRLEEADQSLDRKFALQGTENKRIDSQIDFFADKYRDLSQLRDTAEGRVAGIERDFGEDF